MDVSRPAKDDVAYRPELGEAVYRVMTVTTGFRALTEILAGLLPSPLLRLVIAAGGLGQVLGALLFVVNMWRRVRMPPAALSR